jgi:hypothetical protein
MSKVTEINAETNNVIERERTEAELEQSEKDALEKQAMDAEKAQLEATKIAAKEKLAALGLTTEDLKALGL